MPYTTYSRSKPPCLLNRVSRPCPKEGKMRVLLLSQYLVLHSGSIHRATAEYFLLVDPKEFPQSLACVMVRKD